LDLERNIFSKRAGRSSVHGNRKPEGAVSKSVRAGYRTRLALEFRVPQKKVIVRADLAVRAVHLGNMCVEAHVRERVLQMDYPARPGASATPLEVLLASLAACAVNTLNLVLAKKMGVPIESLEVDGKAQRREEHPTVLTEIELVYHLRGEKLEAEMLERAVRIAEDELCPVLNMLRPGTQIGSTWTIEAHGDEASHAGFSTKPEATPMAH